MTLIMRWERFPWTSENAKNKAVLMANAWLNGFNLKIKPIPYSGRGKTGGSIWQPDIASFGKLFSSRKMILALLSVKPCRLTGVSVSKKSFHELPANSTALL